MGGKANVLFVEATEEKEGLWTFAATVTVDLTKPAGQSYTVTRRRR